MNYTKKLYGIIKEDYPGCLGILHIASIYVAEQNKDFIRIISYIGNYKQCFTPRKHALNSLSRGAFETRMRKVKTYNIGLLSEEEYEEIMVKLIQEIL